MHTTHHLFCYWLHHLPAWRRWCLQCTVRMGECDLWVLEESHSPSHHCPGAPGGAKLSPATSSHEWEKSMCDFVAGSQELPPVRARMGQVGSECSCCSTLSQSGCLGLSRTMAHACFYSLLGIEYFHYLHTTTSALEQWFTLGHIQCFLS